MKIQFFVSGIPKAMSVGKSVAFRRAGSMHHFQKRNNSEWGVMVGQMGRHHAPSAPLDGPVSFRCLFLLPKPSTAGKNVVAPLKRPDIDNLVHKLSDHFNGIFWRDDSQIIDFAAYKRFADPGGQVGVQITIEQVMPGQQEIAL